MTVPHRQTSFKGVNMFKQLAVVTMMVSFLVGCNTIHGVGKDIERGGEKLQNASEKAQDKLHEETPSK